MAIGLPFHDQSWSPADAVPEATPTPAGAEAREGSLDLGLVRAVIEDGLLMVFGPDGDPIPPEIFAVAAAEQPDAGIEVRDGLPVAAERIAAVLDAQMRGQLGAAGGGADHAWIEAMLGVGPQPTMAEDEDLLAEDGAVKVVAFGKELLITSPSGESFLIAQTRSRHPHSICLRLADEGPIALSDLVARLLAGPGAHRSDAAFAHRDEFAAPDCRAWFKGDELVVDLPTIGQVHLAQSLGDAGTLASVFMSNGETATLEDLARDIGRPAPARSAAAHGQAPTPPAAAPTRALPLSLALPDGGGAGADGVALVLVRGLPEAASLSAGAGGGDGSWLLSPQDLSGLSLMLPAASTADLALEVVAIRIASRDGELASTSGTMVVPAQSDTVVFGEHGLNVEVAPAPIPLGLNPHALREGGAFDVIVVLDAPSGASLSPATYDAAIDAWVVLPRQLAELCVLPAAGHDQDFTLSLFGLSLQPDSREDPRLLAQIPVTVRQSYSR
jgi:hypothetical protein